MIRAPMGTYVSLRVGTRQRSRHIGFHLVQLMQAPDRLVTNQFAGQVAARQASNAN